MKRLALLLFGCLFGLLAQAQSTVWVVVEFSPTAVSYATGMAGFASSTAMTNNCVTSINNKYAAQGISISVVANTVDLGSSAPGDSVPMNQQFTWAQQSMVSTQKRSSFTAAIAILVAAPPGGSTVAGIIPATPPAQVRDSVAAVNVYSLCSQLEDALSRNIGAQLSKGVSTIARRYPYEGGGSLCFHTRDAAPNPSSATVAYDYWQLGTDGLSQAENPANACTNYLNDFASSYPPGETVASVCSGGLCGCQFYKPGGAPDGSVGLTHVTTGSSTLSCSSDTQISSYSQNNGTPYLGLYAIGDPTRDNVGAMNARISTMGAFSINAAQPLQVAVSNFVMYFKLLHW